MTLFLENPLPIWSLGAVCLAIAVIVFLSKRSLGAVLGVVGVIAVTLLLLFVERVIITPSEEVEESLTALMAAIEANDLPGVVGAIDPAAKAIRTEAETLMPQVKIKETGMASVQVELDDSNPLEATAFFRGRIDGTHARTGVRVFYFDQVEIDWRKAGDTWRVIDYRAKFRGKPINATEGFRMALIRLGMLIEACFRDRSEELAVRFFRTYTIAIAISCIGIEPAWIWASGAEPITWGCNIPWGRRTVSGPMMTGIPATRVASTWITTTAVLAVAVARITARESTVGTAADGRPTPGIVEPFPFGIKAATTVAKTRHTIVGVGRTIGTPQHRPGAAVTAGDQSLIGQGLDRGNFLVLGHSGAS